MELGAFPTMYHGYRHVSKLGNWIMEFSLFPIDFNTVYYQLIHIRMLRGMQLWIF